ncbi:vacuolar sorting-associated 53 -like protein, partial [Brachionus plicatilis]
RFAEDVKTNGFPKLTGEDSNNLHNSAADLFIFYKNCMSQCLQLFTNNNLLCKLTVTFQKYLREYSNRVLNSSLPKISSGALSSYSSISGAASNLIQNFQIQNMLKENQTSSIANALSLDSKKLNDMEISKICSILCTTEYCLETTQQLEDKLKEKVSVSTVYGMTVSLEPKQIELYTKKINFSIEKDIFSTVISNTIQLLVQDLENSCEPALMAMSKISWQTYSSVGDQSSYITSIIGHLKHFVPLCKLISQAGIEQLLLDTHSLKTALMEMPTFNAGIARKAPSTYTKIVLKEMGRGEMILKSVMTPGEPIVAFVENYLRLVGDNDPETFRSVVEMKGYKKSDLALYLEIFRSKVNSVKSSQDILSRTDFFLKTYKNKF